MIPSKSLLRVVALVLALGVMAGMAVLGLRVPSSRVPVVVSGVTQWGALARDVLGPSANVVTLLSDPNADPHDHEATTTDAARVAEATLVIENGAGYDTWLSQLVAARPSPPPVIDVAALVGVSAGRNPHVFYDLAAARRFVERLVALESPRLGARRLEASASAVLARIARLQAQVSDLRASCAGVPVAATEDVTGYLLSAMGLRVVTPEALRLAVGNGVDPSVADLATALGQLRQHPALLIDNVQTATPLTAQMVSVAEANGVPVIRVTETMRGSDYPAWIGRTITQIRAALTTEGCA